jgi:hypothetical protein
MLTRALSDPSPEVRRQAAALLGEFSPPVPSVFEALERAAISDDAPSVRRAALRAVAATMHPDAAPVLERIYDETGDHRAENLLIDLRLRLAEARNRDKEPEAADTAEDAEGPVPAPPRSESTAERILGKARNAFDVAGAVVLSTVRSRNDPGKISPWRMAALVTAAVLLTIAAVHARNVLEAMNPRPRAETYVCPVCGLHQKQVLGPDARCEQCGAYFFADNLWEQTVGKSEPSGEGG